MVKNYIEPVTKIHPSFAEAKEYYDRGAMPLFEDEPILGIETLAHGTRNLVVGEPGVGKSLLMERIRDHLDATGSATALINLRDTDAAQQIDAFLVAKSEQPKALLLDALDEVKSSIFPETLQKIEAVSKALPDMPIFLSARWIFASRYANSFPEFRFITISPFTREQVRQYLLAAGRLAEEITALMDRVMSLGRNVLVIQIPRYLYYLDDFLKAKGVEAAARVTRNELFEHFIYAKLELEEEKLNADKRAMTKRVLEKLALAMEIYQTNVITTDELVTFFDDLQSDLKLVALSQVGIEVFYDYSILKVSHEALEKVEFENAEFQEYLAAKELTRFPDPNRAAFSFAVDPNIGEIYPTWYNALTFLVDMQDGLLEQLIEFSGLRGDKFKLLDDGFLAFLSRVDPRKLSPDLKRRLFIELVAYHERTLQWLPGQLAEAMPALFDPSLEVYLKERVAEAEPKTDEDRFVPLGNVAYVAAYLLEGGMTLDTPYWREKLMAFTQDANINGVMQRHSLMGLEHLGDTTVIDELPNLLDSRDELVNQAFLSMCTRLAPDHPKSVDYFLEAVRRNSFYGRYGLFAVTQPEAIKRFLRTFNEDEQFRREFMDDTRIFKDQDFVLAEHIGRVMDAEIRELCEAALVNGITYHIGNGADYSAFLGGIWKLLRKDTPNFVPHIIDRIRSSPAGQTGLYFAQEFFMQLLELEDVEPFVTAMIAANEKYSAQSVMNRIKYSKREDAMAMYEAGRPFLAEDYRQWEEAQAKPQDPQAEARAKATVEEFRRLLEPEPGKYDYSVFDFYVDNADTIDPALTTEDRMRIETLFTGTVFKFMDPGQSGLTVTEQHERGGSKSYTTTSAVRIFSDAMVAARRLGFDTTPYRQKILNLIPFAYNEELKTIFELVKEVTSAEMQPIIEIYQNRHTDLWWHNPGSFIEAVQKFHIVGAAPVLKEMVLESAWERGARLDALVAIDSMASDAEYLRSVVERYRESENQNEKDIALAANGLLVTSHGDAEAIRWRLGEVVRRAAAHVRPRSGRVHSVDDLEDEISFSQKFAKPLKELKRPGYENEYLAVLEEAMNIWARGAEFQEYSAYLWGIVYSYFDNLKEQRSYAPLQALEGKIAGMRDRNGANWLAHRMVQLRREYLAYLGKPRTISEAVARYNDVRSHDDKKIRNSADLFRHVQNALDTDLRRWIEDEGAYAVLDRTISTSGRQEYEKLVQKTLMTQIKGVFLERGFRITVLRESQLLDDKRTDLLIQYGFAGPIVVEVKLTSNSDLRGNRLEESKSYKSMEQYMKGYGAEHGVFLVINNTGARNQQRIAEAFQKIKGVWVAVLDSHQVMPRTRRTQARPRRAR